MAVFHRRRLFINQTIPRPKTDEIVNHRFVRHCLCTKQPLQQKAWPVPGRRRSNRQRKHNYWFRLRWRQGASICEVGHCFWKQTAHTVAKLLWRQEKFTRVTESSEVFRSYRFIWLLVWKEALHGTVIAVWENPTFVLEVAGNGDRLTIVQSVRDRSKADYNEESQKNGRGGGRG